MLGFLRGLFQKSPPPRTIYEALKRDTEELKREPFWIGHVVVSSDGLKIFSESRESERAVERIAPYALKMMKFAKKSHERHPGVGSAPPTFLAYRTIDGEVVMILQGCSVFTELYLIFVAKPPMGAAYSIDRTLSKLRVCIRRLSVDVDKILRERVRRKKEGKSHEA